MEKIKNNLPLTVSDCYSLINHFKAMDEKSVAEEIGQEYVKLLNNWASFLHAVSYLVESIEGSVERGLDMKELVEKGYIG